MNSSLMDSNHSRNESQIFDDLSLFIQIFKRSLSMIELASISIQKGNQYMPQIQKIKHSIEQCQPLLLKYQNQSDPLFVENITFHRFTCRLLEIINLFKMKYQQDIEPNAFVYFMTCLKEIQGTIRKYHEEKMFGKIIKIIQISFIKFCMNSERKNSGGKKEEKCQFSDTYNKMNQKIKKYKKQQKTSKQKYSFDLCESDYSSQKQQDEYVCLKSDQKNKIPTISQVFVDIQKRFDLFKGLDLDYSNFKGSYFLAKNSTQQFYRQYFDRNFNNAKIITTYHDDFYLFQKKNVDKENKRKDKRNKIKADQSLDQVQQYKKQDNKDFIRLRRNKINQTFDQKLLKDKLISLTKQTNSNKELPNTPTLDETPKISYKMKNIYLTLGKKNGSRQHKAINNGNISPSVIKKKAGLQAMSINQSYYNDMEFNTTNSIGFLLTKLKFERSEDKNGIATRIKTQNCKDLGNNFDFKNKHATTTVSQEPTSTGTDTINSPIKPQKKNKYLQVNCLKRDPNVHSRIMLSGINTNIKFPIKHVPKKLMDQKNRLIIELKEV